MSEKSSQAPRTKIYSFDDMPTVERDGFQLFGTIYYFVGPQDLGGQGMADVLRLQERVPQIQDELERADEEADKLRLSEELVRSLCQATQLIFFDEIPDDELDKLSIAQHQHIHDSFTKASASGGQRLAEAMAATKARAAVTSGK